MDPSSTRENARPSGKAVIDFQNSRFTLAEMKTEVQVGSRFPRSLSRTPCSRTGSTATTAAMVKTCGPAEMQGKVLDACLQLHGGYGFMWEYPITRAYA